MYVFLNSPSGIQRTSCNNGNVMYLFYQYGSHVAAKHLICSQCDLGTKLLMLFNFNLHSHMLFNFNLHSSYHRGSTAYCSSDLFVPQILAPTPYSLHYCNFTISLHFVLLQQDCVNHCRPFVSLCTFQNQDCKFPQKPCCDFRRVLH